MEHSMSTAFPRVYLVRHGETAWSLSGQHTGRTDIPLTAHGVEMARGLRTRLQDKTFSVVLSSPLSRARHTAELAGFADVMQIDADLMEWDYGRYEGQRTVDIRAERPGWGLFENGSPGGETIADVADRAERVIARIRAQDGDALLFAHRDILRVLAACWVSLPPIDGRRFNLEPASISILGYDHQLTEPLIQVLNSG
jgi:broad specificity phosphatase PhoE